MMSIFIRASAAVALSLAISAMPVAAANAAETTGAAASAVYKPPLRGAPATRVSGASRGAMDQTVLLPLAPDHVGLTTSPQPIFQWYAAGSLNGKLEFTLNEGQKTVLETTWVPNQPGVQNLDLANHRYSLKPGVEYEWRVALIVDVEQRAADLIAGGAIRYEPASAELQTKLKQAKPQELPALYAEAGQWYDALASLSAQIAARPQDKALRTQRATLLEQVGLTEAATADRLAAPE